MCLFIKTDGSQPPLPPKYIFLEDVTFETSFEKGVCLGKGVAKEGNSITRARCQENRMNMKETSNSLVLQEEQRDA